MLLNLDIWCEIVNYLKYPQETSTLRSLAATCRGLSNIALDAIWRDGERILDIALIINSFASSTEEPFLTYAVHCLLSDDEDEDTEDDNSSTSSSSESTGSWALNRPIPPAACRRALQYLARIRKLVVRQDSSLSGYESIWPILLTCLGPHGPILPNLQHLEIDFHTFGRNEYLIPLLSPPLKNLLISSAGPPKHNMVSTMLNLANARGCDLEGFVYAGRPTHKVFVPIMSFTTLKNVTLPHHRLPHLKASITIIQFLSSLPSLRSFTCHIEVFLPLVDGDRFYHTGLQKIKISSKAQTLQRLFHVCVFPSLTRMKIVFEEILSMEGIESSCPNISDFKLYPAESVEELEEPLEFRHLASLRSLPMWSFNLRIYEHTLTPINIHDFAQSWPNIRFLKIDSCTYLEPLSTLITFSNHQHINELDLDLSLPGLFDDIPTMRGFIVANIAGQGSHNTTLCKISLHCDYDRPERETPVPDEDKRTLVEYLLRLFPNLIKLQFTGWRFSSEPEPGDLQDILEEMSKGAMSLA